MVTIAKSLQNISLNLPDFSVNALHLHSTTLENEAENAFIVHYLDNLLNQAIQQKASDIHFEPYENFYRIRFRCDGLLHEMVMLPPQFVKPLITRIKITANLDIAEQRLPQDGNCSKIFNENKIDFRISSCPTVFGEKIVMRLLNPSATPLDIEQLGFSITQKHLFIKTLRKPQGLILVTGPTGSGKTTTLYTALRILNTTQVNIATVEDPVEIHLPGINQVNVHNKIGLNFARVLRALLRQDPDIILIGEIRDEETADIAIKAAQTGHLVFATLHTNNAFESIARLLNMGVAAYNLASATSLIIAQRLVRKLCNHCKQAAPSVTLSENLASNFNTALQTIYQATGCNQCLQGYCGRTAIYEMLTFSESLKQLLLQNENLSTIYQQACAQGLQSLQEAGFAKVAAGITSIEEVYRVI